MNAGQEDGDALNAELVIALFYAILIGKKKIVIRNDWMERLRGGMNEVQVRVELGRRGNYVVSLRTFRKASR